MIRRWIDWRVMDLIKDNQTFFNRLHVVIDACVISVSYVVSWAIQFTFFVPETTGRCILPVHSCIFPGYD